MKKEFKTLEITHPREHVLLITLNRPEVRNALNTHMMQELYEIWHSYYIEPRNVRCIIMTGAGDKAFCSGADLKERHGITAKIWQQQHALLERMISAMSECPLPIIAAVNGYAMGAGLELMLACDFAYGSDNSQFAFPEAKLGIIPGAMGTQQLPRAIGVRRAKEFCMSGQVISAAQAMHYGLLNKIFPKQELLAKSIEMAETIAKQAPIAIQQLKRALNMSEELGLREGYCFELEAYNRCIATKDRLEGVAAFNEKREPVFTGE